MPLARILLLLLSPALMASGCSDRRGSLAGPPDARDLADASAAPDVIPGDAAMPCGVQPGSGYSALDTGFGVKTIDLQRPLFLGIAVRDPRGRTVLLLGDGMFGAAILENDVVRLDDNGQLDDSFGDHGWVRLEQTIRVDAIVVDELGRIYLGSLVGTTPETTEVRRLTEDGALDLSFGTAGDGSVHDLDGSLLRGNRTWKAIGTSLVLAGGSVAVRLDEHGAVAGRIVAPSYVTAVTGDEHATYLANEFGVSLLAFAVDGTPITAFGTDGAMAIPPPMMSHTVSVHDMTMGADGSIDVLASYDGFDPAEIVRVTARGELDPAWGAAGRAPISGVFDSSELFTVAHRCDDADVAVGGVFAYGFIATGRVDAHGGGSSRHNVMWSGTGYGANALYDERTGAYILVASSHASDPSGPGALSIQLARLPP